MGEAGIVVVTYESEAEIGACLDRAQPTGAEIVVVDNASTDQTCQEVTRRGVRLITNPENRGFAAAVNQGIDRKSTRLNSSHLGISYAVFCLKKKKNENTCTHTSLRLIRLTCEFPERPCT